MPSVSLIFTALLGLSAAATGRAAYTAGYLVEYFRQCEPGNFVDVDDSGATDPQLSITIPQINYPASSQWVQPNGENLPFTDEFAARFTGELYLAGQGEGEYTFCLESDDGSKLWINGAVVVDDNYLHSMNKVCGTVNLPGSGKVPFKVTFFENRGDAGLILRWKTPNNPTETVVPKSVFVLPQGAGPGVRAEFFRECHQVGHLADLHLDRKQPFAAPTIAESIEINFPPCTDEKKPFWCPTHEQGASCQADPSYNNGKQTVPCMPFKDFYAARFTGNLLLDQTIPGTPETCYFRMTSDDGAVLYINGTKVVDDDGVHGMQARVGSIELRQSSVYLPFRLEYFENLPPGGLKLEMKGCGYPVYKVLDYTKFQIDDKDKYAANPPDRMCPELKPINSDESNEGKKRDAVQAECAKDKKFIWCDQVPFPSIVGDGRCDEQNNLEGCWDGGDCCKSTCVDGHYSCSINKFDTCHAGFKSGLSCDVREDIKVLSYGDLVETVTVPSINWPWGPPKASTWPYLNVSGNMKEYKSFGLFISGFMYVSNAGEYIFCLGSDDDSMLFIDSKKKEVVDNSGLHGAKEVCESKWMSPGFHPLHLRYRQAGQYCGLTLDVQGPVYLDKQKFGKARIRPSWLWWADVCPKGVAEFSGHGKCIAEVTSEQYGVPYNHTCSCDDGWLAGAGTCLLPPDKPTTKPNGNGWMIFTIIWVSLAVIACVVGAWKRDAIKRYLLSTLASARFYQHVEPLNGKDDRVTTEL